MKTSSQDPSEDLELLREQLRDMLPWSSGQRTSGDPPPNHERPLSVLHESVTSRLRIRTQRRRWVRLCSASAIAAVLATSWMHHLAHTRGSTADSGGALGVVHATQDEGAPWAEVIRNDSGSSAVYELAPEVGRLLVRPGTAFRYDPIARQLALDAGEIVAHIDPGGRGLRVITPSSIIKVTGTLFSVRMPGSVVRVWHGSVEQLGRGLATDGTAAAGVQIRGDERYDDLSSSDAAWLSFTIPAADHREAPMVPPVAPAMVSPVAPAMVSPVAPPVASPMAPPRHPSEAATAPPARPPESPGPRQERILLLEAQARLSDGDPKRAEQLLTEHERSYPQSPLAEERAILLLRASVQLSNPKVIARRARSFLAQFPHSAHVREIENLQRATATSEDRGSSE